MFGSRLGASTGRDQQRRIEGGEHAHTLPMVCDMLG